jgi:translation initiation factor IF-1
MDRHQPIGTEDDRKEVRPGSGVVPERELLPATVVELLPHAILRVMLDNRKDIVLVHASGAREKNFVRLRPGDRVEVSLSPHDPGRGRLVRLIGER